MTNETEVVYQDPITGVDDEPENGDEATLDTEEAESTLGSTPSEDGEGLDQIPAYNQAGEDITGEPQPGLGGGGVSGVSYDVAVLNERMGYEITAPVVDVLEYDSEMAARASLEGAPQAVGGTDTELVSEIHPERLDHPEPGPDGPPQEILDEAEAAQEAQVERAEELLEAGVIDSITYQEEEVPSENVIAEKGAQVGPQPEGAPDPLPGVVNPDALTDEERAAIEEEEIPQPGEGTSEEVPTDAESEVGPVGYPDDLEAKPTEENTVAEIKEYLDAHGIEYTSSLTKSELLELV